MPPSRTTLTKAEIVDTVYERVGGFSKKEASDLVETVFDILKDQLHKSSEALGEEQNLITAIKISGFGNFLVRYKRKRIDRNPATQKPLLLDARKVLTWRPSQKLKRQLNPHRTNKSHSED